MAIGFLIVVIVVLIAARALVGARELQLRLVCCSNLKGIAASFNIYGPEGWDKKMPPVEWLIAKGYVEPRQAICPSLGDTHSNYVLLPPLASGPGSNSAIMAFEPKSNHGDGGNVLFADGHAEFLSGGDYDKIVGPLLTAPE